MTYHPRNIQFERIIRGWITVSAVGTNLCAFADSLRREGVICRRQQMKNDILRFIIRRCDRRITERIARESEVSLVLTEHKSIPQWISQYKNRLGIPIGLIFGIGILVYSANVVMVIEIQGNSIVSDVEIEAVLRECGVKRGVFIGNVDFYRSENRVRATFDEVTWVGMRHTGNRVVVEVMETEKAPKSLDNRIPCHIIAAKTAQITDTQVSSGQFLYTKGDAVKAGEVIVSGIRTDKFGGISFTHASGSIIGIYEESVTFICDEMSNIRALTGRETENKTLDLFTVRIPLSHEENPYSDYNIRTETTPLTLFGKELPISVDSKVWMEYDTELRVLSEEEQRENLLMQQKRYEANFLSDSDIISAKPKFIKKETAMVLTVSYVIEGEIGREQELLLKSDRKPYVANSRKED